MFIYCLLIGALIAQRFKVIVLVPALALTAIVAATIGYHQQAGPWRIVGSTLIAMACLQIGYIAGAAMYYLAVRILPRSILGRSIGASFHRTAH